MRFDELKRLEFNKDSLKKVERFIKTVKEGSPEYYKSLCLKGAMLHSIGKSEEALKLLLDLEGKMWVLQNDDIISLCDTLKLIFFDFGDTDRALKYINTKKDHLGIINKDQYLKDMALYYHNIKDRENEKRYLYLFLDENVDPTERLFGYERLIEYQYEEHSYDEFMDSFNRLYEFYTQNHNESKINHLNYLKCNIMLYQNKIDEVYEFSTKMINDPSTNDNMKLFYASQMIKFHLSKDELRKASTIDADYGELLKSADAIFKKEYLKSIYSLYSSYGNRTIVENIQKELDILEESMPKASTQEPKKHKKIEILDPIIVKPTTVEQPIIEEKVLTPEVNPTLNPYVSEAYFVLNESLLALNMESEQIREPIRKSLVSLNKTYKFRECHIIYTANNVYDGWQYKDGRLYEKHFKNKEAISSSIPVRVLSNGKEYLNDNIKDLDTNIDIVTLRPSIYRGVITYPLMTNGKSYGSVSYYFDDIDFSLEFEILRSYSLSLSDKISGMLYKDDVIKQQNELNELVTKIPYGIKRITDDETSFNLVAKNIYNISVSKISNNDFYDLLGSNSKSEYKAIINSFYNGTIKEASLKYTLFDGRIINEDFYLYELTDHIIINSLVSDITKKVEEEKKLNDKATLDSLTPLPGFRGFEEDVLKLNENKKYSVMLMDAKNFKLYFDIYGLKFHNDLIKAIGLKMLELKDKYNALMYHYDSDKFIVILNNNDERSTIKKYKEFLDELSLKLFELNYRVKLSFKGAILRVLGKSPNYTATKVIEMLSNSLGALKDLGGGNEVTYYDSKLAEARFYDFQMELHISEAIDKGLLSVCYSQVANMKEKGTFAYMSHLSLSNAIVSEAYFEAVIKKRGLYLQADKYLITHSLMELKSFYKEFNGYFNLIIPIHKATICDSSFLSFYYEKIKLLKVNPKYVYFEIVDDVDPEDLKDIDFTYLNLCVHSLDVAFSMNVKFYISKYKSFDMVKLNTIKDALALSEVGILIDDVKSMEDIDYLTQNEYYLVRGSILGKIYKISDIMALLSDKKI